jgi:hypothetical protein
MKKHLLILVFIALAQGISAQGIYNDGAVINSSGNCFWVVSQGTFTLTSRSATNLTSMRNLYIQSGASLSIDSQSYLTVEGFLANNASQNGLILKSDASGTASLIHNSNNVNATIQRFFSGSAIPNNSDYHFISIPVNSTVLSEQFLGMYLYRFDVPTQDWVSMGSSTTTPLYPNLGYMVFYPHTDTTLNYKGQMINGAFHLSTPATAAGQYCLVPNPYPSAIDWDAVGWTKTNIDDAIWIWNAAAGNYATYGNDVGTFNSTGIIPLGQGFMVKSNAASPVLTTANSVRLHDAQAYYKTTENPVSEVFHLKVSSDAAADEIIVRFANQADRNHDFMDINKIFGQLTAPQLYTLSENDVKLTVNALNHTIQQITVPLGMEYSENQSLTFNASGFESFESSVSIFLEDKLLNKTIDLHENPAYTFTNQAGMDPMRFNLLFYGINNTEELNFANYYIWVSNNQINIQVPELTGQKAVVELIDLQGRIIRKQAINLDNPSLIDTPDISGIYLIRLSSGNQTFTSKVFIR